MLYSEILAKTHEELERRLAGQSSIPESSSATFAELETSGNVPATTTAASSSASTAALDPHMAFAASLATWPVFLDTVSALRELSALGLKLIVLSNVDRASFAATQKALEHGFTFDAILTAQDIGSYKYVRFHPEHSTPTKLDPSLTSSSCRPDLRNFHYALSSISSDFSIPASNVLVVAQSLPHDHVPAARLGLGSVWIDRRGAYMCLDGEGVPESAEGKKKLYGWRFETLSEFAEAIGRAKKAKGK